MDDPAPLAGLAAPLPAPSVVELVRRRVAAAPHATAVTAGASRWDYATLWGRVGEIAALLRETGVGPGDRVALWAARSPAMIAAALAVMSVRAAYVPLDPTSPASRTRAVLDAAAPALLAHDGDSAVPAPPTGLTVSRLELSTTAPGRAGRAAGALPLPSVRADDLAYVIFTSGSTGEPKGVLVEHRSLVNYVAWCAATVPGQGGSPLFGSLGYDLSMTALWPALASGGAVSVVDGAWDTKALFAARDNPFTLIKLTPSQLRLFERTRRPDYRHVTRALVIGGEALDAALVRSLGDRVSGVTLVNHYGPTEATVGCCFHVIDAATLPPTGGVPIGGPVWNTRLHVVRDDLGPAPADSPGELVVAGLGVARGYLGGDPDGRFLDAAALARGVSGGRVPGGPAAGGGAGRAYRTGDIVERLPGGALRYLGRRDGQVKVSGHRIETAELRRHALSVDGVLDVAFDVVPGLVDALEAFVVPRDSRAAAGIGRRVRRAMAAALPAAAVPTRVHVVPRLVLTENGKCDPGATRLLLCPDTTTRAAFPRP